MFGSGKALLPGNGLASIERQDGVIYMAIPLRNVGAGMAILHGWHITSGWLRQRQETHPEIAEFRQQLRDLYIPPSDTGFWQATIRDAEDDYRPAVDAVLDGEEEGRWICSVTRHWNLEGPDPRADVH